jgi:predicted transcriptional regulator
MRVLLSIKPKYAERIFSGEKQYEFRRVLFKRPETRVVVVYASAPVSKVVGEFEISGIISDSPSCLWAATKEHAGIDEDSFFDYFAGQQMAHAIKVKNPTRYQRALDIREEFSLRPPQSFAYLPN